MRRSLGSLNDTGAGEARTGAQWNEILTADLFPELKPVTIEHIKRLSFPDKWCPCAPINGLEEDKDAAIRRLNSEPLC
jgi:hypothetical protein